MTNVLKKVQSGDPLAIPAATFNTFVDAAQDFLRRQRSIGRTPVADRPPFETVLLKNASGADRSRFDVLGIDAPVFTPTDSLETFTNGIALVGVTPTASHAGNFAVLVEPIQAGQIGRACILGACPVKVNVVCVSDAFADVEAGAASRLKSGSAGAAEIIWIESDTGLKWGIVRIGARGRAGWGWAKTAPPTAAAPATPPVAARVMMAPPSLPPGPPVQEGTPRSSRPT